MSKLNSNSNLHPASSAIRLGTTPRLSLAIASAIGLVAFFWPFLLSPSDASSTFLPPLLFGAILILVLAVVFADIAHDGIDAKAIAMLGILAAVGAAIRPLGAGTAGIETIFFTLVIAGRVFGPAFGFALGCTTLLASALLTAGVGPWMPYQMFGCAFVGLVAGLLPPVARRLEVPMLAAYGAISSYAFGFLINLSFWPFNTDPHSTVAYLPGAPLSVNIHRYLVFDATTSLGWDTGRAITTATCILILGPALLATFRRASRRACFRPPTTPHPPEPAAGDNASARGEAVVKAEDRSVDGSGLLGGQVSEQAGNLVGLSHPAKPDIGLQ
jgi:energy-coupling factor transport system substrate-specific component